AAALTAGSVVEGTRDGRSVADLMQAGGHVVGRGHVMAGVAEVLPEAQDAATSPDGTQLVSGCQPIREKGPAVPWPTAAERSREHRRPAGAGGSPLSLLRDQRRPVVRPRDGERAPARHPFWYRGPVRAGPDADGATRSLPGKQDRLRVQSGRDGSAGRRGLMSTRIGRAAYADMYGPTVGDRVRLADTELFIEVERDLTIYGEEVKFGGGKVIRDGMGQSQATRAAGTMDTVITNALIVDHWGIVKADVGIRDGRIAAIGKAGN